jgi:hypothetical protein
MSWSERNIGNTSKMICNGYDPSICGMLNCHHYTRHIKTSYCTDIKYCGGRKMNVRCSIEGISFKKEIDKILEI